MNFETSRSGALDKLNNFIDRDILKRNKRVNICLFILNNSDKKPI
jgi:hypothetical protein|tara:strand:- start:345 stop:479 length:135 start_codon:yes stop_codon:yes gene_type:complete